MSPTHKTTPSWFNFVTDQFEDGPGGKVDQWDDETASKYIPQDPNSQAIYHIKRKQGASVSEALIYTLKAGLPPELRDAPS